MFMQWNINSKLQIKYVSFEKENKKMHYISIIDVKKENTKPK